MRGQPFVSQSVIASGPQAWNTWSLAGYQSFVADTPANQMSADVTLQESGRVIITPHYRANDATTALVMEVGSAPKGMVLQIDGVGRDLRCSGSPSVLEAGRVQIELGQSPGGWTARFNNQTLQCSTSDSMGQPAITAGLRRIGVHHVGSNTVVQGGPGGQAVAYAAGLGFLALG